MHGEGGGRPPFGWTATGGGTAAFAPVPAEIAVLERIRDLRAAGWLIREIVDELNDAGERMKTGGLWTRDGIDRALYTIRRFGIPADIDAATKAAHRIAAQKKAGEISNKTPSGRSQQRGIAV